MEEKSALLDFWKHQLHISEKVLDAFRKVERRDFVPEEERENAYDDRPLPILRGKTISQPTTVMFMTSLLDVKEGQKILELGTGSGYQSAILAYLVGDKGKVISTEVVPELVQFSRENLQKAGMKNVTVLEEDGSRGVKSQSLFDRIIITAACREIPPLLISQLKAGGIVVAPVGNQHEQQMVKGVKKGKNLDITIFGSFVFSSLVGKYGFEI